MAMLGLRGEGVKIFGWMAEADPPMRWDLRGCGWTLCSAAARDQSRHVLLADVRHTAPEERLLLADRAPRLLMIGVERGEERAELLLRGCAEVVSERIGLHELAARAARLAEALRMLPAQRRVGPLTLDLFHRDARLARCWLNLHPREFALLWRLADVPGARVTRRQLLADVWRISREPETNSVEVHVSRLRTKLSHVGCGAMIETAPEGGYRLSSPFMLTECGLNPLAKSDQSAATATPSRSRSR